VLAHPRSWQAIPKIKYAEANALSD
jgi:hypothetical protein